MSGASIATRVAPSLRSALAASSLIAFAATAVWWSGADAQDDGQAIVEGTGEAPDPAITAIFAGGCFWCMESAFDEVDGVLSTTSGYINGTTANPTYEQVSGGGTGHAEALEIEYDPATVSYAQLLDVFWRNIDPFDANGQFCDKGDQYRAEIFYLDDEQQRLANESKRALEESGRFDQPLVTRIEAADTFHPAETYHQDYYEKNPLRYKFYYTACRREARLEEVWGDPS